MVPGMTLGLLASTVFLPALGAMLLGSLLSGGGLSSIFGGGTKKVTRTETLWSYRISDPKERAFALSKLGGSFYSENAEQQKDNLKKYDGKEFAEKEVPDNLRGAYLKPSTELDRGDWPEEAWFLDIDKPGESVRNPNIIAPGRNIALLTDKQLPKDIFKGNTQQQFITNSKLAAKTKINQLLDNLLTMNTRLYQVNSKGERAQDDTTYTPNEIWTHDEQDVRAHEGLINTVYGQGAIGLYQDWIKGNRRGVGFDQNMSLLVRWVHWQY
jgi:hypothetical protein